MYQVIKIITNDGEMFDTEKEAKKHVERKYTDLVSRIAGKLIGFAKYQEVKEFLDDNIELFDEMSSLKNELLKGVEK